jgi:multiple sugar transport system permease protein
MAQLHAPPAAKAAADLHLVAGDLARPWRGQVLLVLAGDPLDLELVAAVRADRRQPGKEVLFVVLLLALIVPYQALLTPMFLMFAKLGIINTLVGLAVLHTAIQLPFSLYVLRNSLGAVPRELEEAAVVDGASSLQVLVRVMVPASVPAIVTVALFAFIMSWNEFLGALVMMNRSTSFTLPLILAVARTQTSLGGTDWGMLQAGITISVIPCVLFYLLLQRYYVSGLMSGAVK